LKQVLSVGSRGLCSIAGSFIHEGKFNG
jgi:hypothetical protein